MNIRRYFFQRPGRFLWLISCSMALLVISQILWLKKVWNEQKQALKTETNYIFQNTMMQLQDSLVERAIEQDTAKSFRFRRGAHPFYLPKHDLGFDAQFQMVPDSIILNSRTIRKREFNQEWTNKDHVKIMITTQDSALHDLPDDIGSVLLRVNLDSMPGSSAKIVLDVERDTLNPVEVTRSYKQALQKAGLYLDFELLIDFQHLSKIYRSHIYTKPVPAGLLNKRIYSAHFEDFNGYLFKKVAPSALFSLALLTLTGFAFFLIFNNLKEQKRLSDQKNEFISNVTHELKTPITTVGVALEALDDFQVLSNPEKTKEYLHISKLELDRLKLMVDKILRLSMFDQETLTLKLEPFDLQDMVVQVMETMSLQARQFGVEMRLLTLEKNRFWVHGDRLHLSGVLFNLLDNALKYRSAQPEIDISMQHFGDYILLHVKDNGIGIEPDYQEQVFEKFFRAPSGNIHNVKGHGLGLSYAAQVIQKHGGGIRLESTLGIGSVFTLEIPASTPPPTA